MMYHVHITTSHIICVKPIESAQVIQVCYWDQIGNYTIVLWTQPFNTLDIYTSQQKKRYKDYFFLNIFLC
jgi:hypothetical protein